MRIAGVDERDNHWEQHQPRFRVYFFEGGDAPTASWATDTYDVTDADVLETIQWAHDRAGTEQLYAVALVGEDSTLPADQRRGLTWLIGVDANAIRVNEAERRCFAAMLDRRGAQPKLSTKQQRELVHMYSTGDYTIAGLAEMFTVSCITVYRTLQRGSTSDGAS